MNVKITAVAVPVLAAAALTAALVPTAAWARDYSDSIGAAGYLHMYADDGYNGQHEQRASYDSDLHNDDFGDELSSYINRTGYFWMLYEDKGYAGARVCVKPRSHDGNIGDNTGLEDDISSVKKLTTSASSCGSAAIIGTLN